jgi:hypothetical protein
VPSLGVDDTERHHWPREGRSALTSFETHVITGNWETYESTSRERPAVDSGAEPASVPSSPAALDRERPAVDSGAEAASVPSSPAALDRDRPAVDSGAELGPLVAGRS